MADIIIENGALIPMDGKNVIIENGSVVIERDKIVDIGKTKFIKNNYKGDVVIDATDKIVLPGLVNGHAHTWFNLFRNIFGDKTIGYLISNVFPSITDSIKQDEVHIGAKLAFIEMIKSGTTSLLDNPPIFVGGKSPVKPTATAVKESGMRCVIAPGMMPVGSDADKGVKEYRRLIRKWHGKSQGRVQIWPSPMEPWPTELLVPFNEVAKKYKVGITIHLAETNEDQNYTMKEYGKRHVNLLSEFGILGPNFVGSHSIWLSDSEMKLLAESGSKVVYAPGSVMSQGSGIAPVAKMLKLGTVVGLGSDGAAFNVDMFEEMRLTALIQKGYNLDPTCISSYKVLEMATIDAAKTLLLDKSIGSIKKGKKADLIIVDVKKAHIVPRHDIFQSLVFSARGGDVQTVIINGKIVMDNKVIKTLDESEIIDKGENAAKILVERAIPPRFLPKTMTK